MDLIIISQNMNKKVWHLVNSLAFNYEDKKAIANTILEYAYWQQKTCKTKNTLEKFTRLTFQDVINTDYLDFTEIPYVKQES